MVLEGILDCFHHLVGLKQNVLTYPASLSQYMVHADNQDTVTQSGFFACLAFLTFIRNHQV